MSGVLVMLSTKNC